MKNRFITNKGLVSAYAFLCGAVEQRDIDKDNYLVIVKEPNDYHVKGFIEGVHVWEIFEKVTDARKFRNRLLPLRKK